MANQLTQGFFIFLGLAALGLTLVIISFRLSDSAKKNTKTLGAILLQIGIVGMCYFVASFYLFLFCTSLFLGLFIVIDPLKLKKHFDSKIYHWTGWVLLAFSCIIVSSVASRFPIYLWIIPFIIPLLPIIIPKLQSRKTLLKIIFWIVLLVYISIIGYLLFQKHEASLKKIRNRFFSKQPSAVEQVHQENLSPKNIQVPTSQFSKIRPKQTDKTETNTKTQTNWKELYFKEVEKNKVLQKKLDEKN